MADLSLGVVVGMSVGVVFLIICGGIIAVCLVNKRSRKRNSKILHEHVMMRKKRSLRRPVYSGRFWCSDVPDVPPPRTSNESDTKVESFVFDGNIITGRESYDRPYISNNLEKSDTNTLKTVGNYGQVSMISYGGPRTSSYRVSSGELEWLEDSQSNLIPKRTSRLSTRPPEPLPTNKPNVLHVNRPPSGYTLRPPSILDRPDSFRSSVAVDLGAQHQKAWMLSSLERQKYFP